MAKVLLYTFFAPFNKSFKIVRLVDGVDKFYIGSSKTLTNRILNNQYDYVIGLGDCGKRFKNLRQEPLFLNRFRNGPICKDGKANLLANLTLNFPDILLSTKPTWSKCNHSGYKVLQTIEEEKLNVKFTFVHVPKNFDLQKGTNIIQNLINNFIHNHGETMGMMCGRF